MQLGPVEIFEAEQSANTALTWVFRGVGWVMMFVGFQMMTSILVALICWLPVFRELMTHRQLVTVGNQLSMLRPLLVFLMAMSFTSEYSGIDALEFLNPPPQVMAGFPGMNMDINCSTDDANATVTLLHSQSFTSFIERTLSPEKLHLKKQVFTLLNLVVKDAGQYKCRATAGQQVIEWPSSHGLLFLSEEVIFLGERRLSGELPDITLDPPRPIIVQRGETGQIICKALGWSVSKLTWKKLSNSGDQPVLDSKVVNVIDKTINMVKATLKITNAQIQDSGAYKCVLTAYNRQDYKLTDILVVVDGGWGKWGSWSICTKTVGGIQTRTRECSNPEPYYGKPCDGTRALVKECSSIASCQEAYPLRFQTDTNPSLGIMKILTNSSWKRLCTELWDEVEEHLTCMAMGYSNSHNGTYDNSTWFTDTDGVSKTSILHNCSIPTTCKNNFNKSQFCKVPVRLSGSNMTYGGRVEVLYKGRWGKICPSRWDFNDVKVICRQLGFEEALAEFIGSDVKDEDIPFVMANVSCTGNELELASCARIDGKLNVRGQCQRYGTGSQALCQPKNKQVLEKDEFYFDIGSNEKLQCSMHNKTNFAKWYFNDQEVQSSTSQRRRTKENGELSIDNVQLSDGGTYECDRLEYVHYYTVYINARFTENVQDKQSLIADTSGIIICGAEGTPSPQIIWEKKGGNSLLNGRRVTQISNGSLFINRVQPEDEGTYICTLQQSKGPKRKTSKDKTIHVYVIIPPRVAITTASNSIKEGESVNLTCKIVVGQPKPKITWFKNETLQGNGLFLHLNKMTKEDEGPYTCKAENAGGSSTSLVNIRVQVPPHINHKLRNHSVPLNSTFKTKCFERGDPEVLVYWTKNGEQLSKNNTLVISQMTLEDNGIYNCTARNAAGTAYASVWIDATVMPQISVPPLNQSVPEGQPVNLSCKASGIPTPTLVWTYNDGELPSGISQTNREGESFLELRNATKKMEGTYRCTATNKANMTSSCAMLHVFAKPTAEVSLNPHPTLTPGDMLQLTCSVNEATRTVTWKKDGEPMKDKADIDTQLDESESRLVIAEVVEEDSGEYSCEARNELGIMAHSAVTINVKALQVPGAKPALLWYYIVGSMAAVILIFPIGCYAWKRRRTAMALPDQEQAVEMELVNIEVDEWEIEVKRVLLQEVIGRGAFGAVWRALLSSPNGKPGNRTVAAKCFTPTAGEEGRKALMREIELGKRLGESIQPNIVKFIGCVTTQSQPILIMEYMPCGDLLGYVRKCRGVKDRYYLGEGRAQELNNYDLVLFAKQIAAGMVFLGSRGIIHRDLAARNILLDNNYVCKVTDFGLAYQSFKYGHGNAKKGCLPIKWTAPEILLGNLAGLSTMSDVWSYGIVLYEIFTLGGIPYDGWSEGKVVAEVTRGYQMPKPNHIDDKLYDMVKRCWHLNPDFRLPFENLRKRMDEYLREETYLHLLDLGSYDTTKYCKVEDIGGEDAVVAEPSVQAAKNALAKRLGKWSSARR